MKDVKEVFDKNILSLTAVILMVIVFFLFIGIPLNDNMTPRSKVQKIYFADDITLSHQAMIKRFNEINEGRIEVIPIDLPFDKFTTNERKELLARSFRSKSDRIDVFSVDLIWVPRFAKWAEPVSPGFERKNKDKLLKYALESCYYNDKLVALPLKIDIGTMYYREEFVKQDAELLSKISKSISWEDLINLGLKVKAKENLYIFQGNNYEGLVCKLFEMILNQDRKFFKNPEFKFNSEKPKKALQLMVDLIYKYKLSPVELVDYNEILSMHHFIDNNGMFVRQWPEFLIDYYRHFPRHNPKIDFKRAPLPSFQGTDNASVFGGWNLMISKFSNHKNAAQEFVQFMISEEAQKMLLEIGDAPPILNEFYDNPDKYEKGEFLKFYKELFKSGVHRPYWVEYTRISDIVAFYAHKALIKEYSVDEALQLIDKTIKKENIVIR